MKPKKFLIYGNELLLGRVNLHKHLLPDNADYSKIWGGGMFEVDRENKVLKLYGESMDFGRFSEEKLHNIILPSYLNDYVIISRRDKF